MKSTSCDHQQIVTISSSSPPQQLSVLHSTSHGLFKSKQNTLNSLVNWMSKFRKRANNYTKGIREHVSLGTNIPETLKGKLSLGTRIIQAGGVEKIFRRSFSIAKGEKLLKAFQCYLSTSAGPISGLLFISTEKVAFQSDKFLILTSPKGDVAKIPYKVLIPLRKIKTANPSEDANKPNKKYIQIVTVDGFEFWFMGFLSYNKSFKCLQQATQESQLSGTDIVISNPRSSIDKVPNKKATDFRTI